MKNAFFTIAGLFMVLLFILLFQNTKAQLTTCQYSISLYDSFGDGWNGGKLDVFVAGTLVLDDITLLSGYGPAIFYFSASTGSEITCTFTPGSFPCEPYYYINNSSGEQVFYAPNDCDPEIGPGELTVYCPETGNIEGFVFNYDGLAVNGASVGLESGPVTSSGPNGHYLLEGVPSGSILVYCGKQGYNPTSDTLDVIPGDTLRHDFILTQPNLVVNPLTISKTLNPNEFLTTSLNILNNGNGPLSWNASVNYLSQPILACEYSIRLYDAYGDGWNGCALDVLVNGDVVLDHITLSNGFGPATYYFDVYSGDEITTQFYSASWVSEPYYYIDNSQGEQVWYSASGNSGPANILPGELMAACGGGDWLTLDFYEGTVDPFGDVDYIPTHLSAANTLPGEVYTAEIIVTSNPDVGSVNVPVTMMVLGNELLPPGNLQVAFSDEVAGEVELSWDWDGDAFQFFIIRRGGAIIGTTTNSSFTDLLPDFGTYCYTVQAVFDEGATIPAGPECIEWPDPTLVVNPNDLHGWVWEGFQVDVHTSIYNTGEGTLSFTFPEFAALDLLEDPSVQKNMPGNPEAHRSLELAKGDDSMNGSGYPVVLGAGGPDNFGYIWIDSDEAGGPGFHWIDISTTGNIVSGLADDNVVGPFNVGFDFPFYNETEAQFWINSNGTIGFTPNYISLGNTSIPTGSSTYKDFIAWMWDDLVFRSGQSQVFYQNFSDRTIIQFNNYGRYGQSGGMWAQVQLFPNGRLFILYDQLDATLSYNSCTVGIQSSLPDAGLQVVYNNNYLHDELAIMFARPAEFIVDVAPSSGTVLEGATQPVTITYSSGEYEPGIYTQDLLLESNDPENAEWVIANTMHVYTPAFITGTVTDNDDGEPMTGVTVTAGVYQGLTDDEGLYGLYVDEGDYNVAFSKPGYLEVIVADTFAASGAVTPIDVGMWDRNYPPDFVLAEIQDEDTWCRVTWAVPQGPYEMSMDDGEADDFFVYAHSGSWNAVKFTPAGYPATIIGGKFFVGDDSFPGPFLGTEFGVAVFDDDGPNGRPGTMLDSTGVTVNNYGWVTLDWLNASITEGNFYLAVYQSENFPMTAPLGVDLDNPTFYRSYSKFQSNLWILSAFQDFMIRAWITGPDGDAMTDGAYTDAWRAVPRVPEGWRAYGQTKSGTLPRILPGMERSDSEKRGVEHAGNRDVQSYTVVRYSDFDPDEGPSGGTATELGTSNGLSFDDLTWEALSPGWYAFGVKALYTSGMYSDFAISNIVGHLFDHEVTVNVTLSTGSEPTGTEIVLQGIDYPYQSYQAITPSAGTALFDSVIHGVYDLSVFKAGYDIYTLSGEMIGSDRIFNVLLDEKRYPPTCLEVDPLTLDAVWCKPLRTALKEDFEGPEFPPEGWQSVHEPQIPGWFRTLDGSVPGWTIPAWDSYYACSVGDQGSVVVACCDYLITPPLDLRESDGYALIFDSYYDGAFSQQAKVEYSYDAGLTWNVLNQLQPDTSWTNITLDLSSLSGPEAPGKLWLAFNANWGGITASGWAIDNVQVKVPVPPASYIDYYVFIDDAFVGSTTDTQWNFIPLNYGQEYTASVAARYSSGLSSKDYDRFVSKFLYPPRNLVGVAPDNAAILQWDPPLEGWVVLELASEKSRVSFPDPHSEYSPTIRQVNTHNASREQWDVQLAFANHDNTGEAGAETDGQYLYTSMWNGNGFQKYSLDGSWVGQVSVGDIEEIRDMAWDPTTAHMFGGQGDNTVYEWSFLTGSQVGQFIAPTAVRAIAYDPNFDGFWANNWSSTITLFDKNGVQLNSFPVGAFGNYYGFAFDEWSMDGPFLWGYSQDMSGNMIVQIEVATGLETGVTYDAGGILINGTGTAGGLFTHPDLFEGTVTIGGNAQNDTYFLLELGDYNGVLPCCVPEILLGYNIYRDGLFVKYQDHQGSSNPSPQIGIEENLEPGIYNYTVTGVYDLEQYGFPGQTGESMEEGPAVVTVDYCFPLEFKETWVQGNFETNHWIADSPNWSVSGQSGNPAPAAEFTWDPIQVNYNMSMESYPLCAVDITEGMIWLDYHVKLETFYVTGEEKLFAEVWNWENQNWNAVAEYSNDDGAFGWKEEHIDISPFAMDKIFKVRFRATGTNSLNIIGWFADNIHIYRTCEPPADLVASINYEQQGIELNWSSPPTLGSAARVLEGYKIYRSIDGSGYQSLAYATGNQYIDMNLGMGLYCYKVSAVYEGEIDFCESEFSNEACEIATSSYDAGLFTDGINIFPNPARDLIQITSNSPMTRISLFNPLGVALYDEDLSAKEKTLNLNGYEPGLYIVRVKTMKGHFSQLVTIVR